MLSRRHLFRYLLGAAAASALQGESELVAAAPSAAGVPGFAGLGPYSFLGLGVPQDSSGSYRLSTTESARQPFGRVEDFWLHIKERSDVKHETLFWLTDGRASFMGAAARFQFLEKIIRPRYQEAGIPVEFAFGLGLQESLFRNYSVSHANARGIWQLQWAGKKYGLKGKDYFDVALSTDKQLEYLKELARDFDWNLELVLVDYNYGPGSRFAGHRSDSNAFRKISHRLPGETRKFVPRVLSAMAIGLAPERYGMFIPRIDSSTAEVTVPRDIHHLELALLLGTDHWNLGNLNPRESVRAWFKERETIVIPKALEESYAGLIDGHPLKDEFHAFVAAAFPAPGSELRHVVQSGETLGGIVFRYRDCGVQGPEQIMLYNGLTSTVIRPGQVLLIPCKR